jgi:hypothetical protein
MNRLKAEHSFVKSLRKICGAPKKYRGLSLGLRDRKVVRDAFMLWLCVLRDLCVEDRVSVNEGRLLAMAKSLDEIDVFEFMTNLDLISDTFLASVEDVSLRDYQGLKSLVVQEGPESVPLRIVMGVIKPHVLNWFRHRDVAGFRAVRAALCFLSRLNLAEQVTLADAAFEQWWQAENDLSQRHDCSGSEQAIISEWFPIENGAIIYSLFSPHHGAGSTYEGIKVTGAKGLVNGYDERLRNVFIAMGWDPDFSGLMQSPYFADAAGKYPVVPSDCHAIQAVPKNWKTYRIVSKEPVAYQFMQLGASAAIQDYLKMRLTSISKHYCVDTEDENRELARLGSIDGSYATVDLSHASDSVSLELALSWFDESCLGLFVRNLRTTYAKFDLEISGFESAEKVQDLIRVEKFAPMGSGLCFPIESIVFCSISESAVRHTRDASRRYAVYGDDIVIDSKAVPWLLEELRDKGFSPNLKKTFFGTKANGVNDFFRESCGGEYLNGYDVTPPRISRKFDGLLTSTCDDNMHRHAGRHKATSISQLITLANNLYDYRTARRFIVNDLLSAGVPLLFDSDGTRGIKSSKPSNNHLRRRYNIHLQRWEVWAAELTSRYKGLHYHEDSYLGEIRLFEYLRLAERMHRKHLLYPEDMVDERMDPYSATTSIRYQWVDVPEVPESTDL